MKKKRVVVATTLLPEHKKRIVDAAKERDIPVSVLLRDMMNHAIRNGFNMPKLGA